jgi:signal transduction histidine kinase
VSPEGPLAPKSKLLQRQLRRALGADAAQALAGKGTIEAQPLVDLLQLVDEAYEQYERDLALRTRSLEISSQELNEAISAVRQASEVKSRFMANMSHELRTPLNGVLGMLEVLAVGRLDAQQRRFVDVALKSGETLRAVIDEVLDFAKIEAGQMRIVHEVVPLRPWLESVVAPWSTRASAKQLDFLTRVAPDVPEKIVTDPLRLGQIVANLLANAVKFTERGAVRVSLARAAGAAPGLELAVQDTGIGIERSRIGELFRAFVQADDSSSRRFGGTGLGLAICAELARLLGGAIEVDSEPGKGSTFRLLLPHAA